MHACGSIIWIFLIYSSQVYTKGRSQVSKASKSKEYQISRVPIGSVIHEVIWKEQNSFKIFFRGEIIQREERKEFILITPMLLPFFLTSCFFSFIYISWRLITLQYCSGFCHTLIWISHEFTCASLQHVKQMISSNSHLFN